VLLESRLHPRNRVVPVLASRTCGPHLDHQGRRRHDTRLAWHPGLRHSVGLARWWHFSINLLWTINGIVFLVLLFVTGQWQRLVPLTWEVFPNALSPRSNTRR
jgi:hypothetical protein